MSVRRGYLPQRHQVGRRCGLRLKISLWVGLKLGQTTSTTEVVGLSLVFVLAGGVIAIHRHPAHRVDGLGMTFGAGFGGVVHE